MKKLNSKLIMIVLLGLSLTSCEGAAVFALDLLGTIFISSLVILVIAFIIALIFGE